MDRLLTLELNKYEEVAIYSVNQRIPNICRIAKVSKKRAIRII